MIKILHLFPNLMNLYGDYQNINVLKRHLCDQGEEVLIIKAEELDGINLMDYDFIYMGSGNESNRLVALERLLKIKDELLNVIEKEKLVLFTGNSMELLAKKIDDKDGLGLIDFKVKVSNNRYTGDVVVRNDKIGDLVGFINTSSIINDDFSDSLFEIIFKGEGLKIGQKEGYHYSNCYGTRLIGPILLKNPSFNEFIVKKLLKDKPYKKIDYEYENKSYEVTYNALIKRK